MRLEDYTLADAERIAANIMAGKHDGDSSTYYSAMLVLSRALLAVLPVARAAIVSDELYGPLNPPDRRRDPVATALDAMRAALEKP